MTRKKAVFLFNIKVVAYDASNDEVIFLLKEKRKKMLLVMNNELSS
jgi:tmRNA-binding protein